MVLADDGPRCSCRRCDSDESLARNLKNTRLSSTRPSVSSSEKPKATQMGPTRPITTRIGPTRPITTQIGPTRPETTQGSPPRGLLVSPGESYVSRTTHLARGVVPHSTRVAKGVILLPARGDLETLLTPQESPREWFSSPQEAIWRLSSAFLGLLVSPGDSPRSFSDYSSRPATLLRVSRTTRLARRLSSEFLGLLVSPGDSPQSFSDYSSRQGTLLRVSRTTRLARGVVTHPGRVAKGVILLPSRGLGSRTIRRPTRLRRHHIANTETISRGTRNIFVMLLWLFAGLHHKNVSSLLPNDFSSPRLPI